MFNNATLYYGATVPAYVHAVKLYQLLRTCCVELLEIECPPLKLKEDHQAELQAHKMRMQMLQLNGYGKLKCVFFLTSIHIYI